MKEMLLLSAVITGFVLMTNAGEPPAVTRELAQSWRSEHRTIDMHQHLDFSTQHLARAIKIMDAAGIGMAVNLGTGTVTPGPNGAPSEFERNKALADALYPGRILHYMTLDYSGWDQPDFSEKAARQIEEGHRLGAAGFKEFKRLGLYLRDGQNKLIRIDDPKLDAMWDKCGELGMPVSIHVADPKAFWQPYDEKNERWAELKDHRGWWFGDSKKYPAWKDLLEALNRVIERHPKTTFVAVHFGNNAEELEWVDAALSRYPNMMVDLAARIPELGRHNHETVHRFFLKHQDRILFGTDFMVYDRLILGSSGNEPAPTDADAEVFYLKEWRWLETSDRNWEHMTPIQGNWRICSIDLPSSVLRKIYFDNARRLLARSLPTPIVQARHISQDFALDGELNDTVWQTATPIQLERATADGKVLAAISTSVRVLWSDQYLYLGYACPFTQLTTFQLTHNQGERYNLNQKGVSLWNRDVAEAFIGADDKDILHYGEFQVAPTNEKLDLMITHLPQRDFAWSSGFETAVRVNQRTKTWTCEMRIPLKAWEAAQPKVGTHWRINFFRCDYANKAYLTWNPSLQGSFHVPQRFGILEFAE